MVSHLMPLGHHLLTHATLSGHAFVESLLLAESDPQTPQSKSSLGKLLMVRSTGVQGVHWRSPAQPHPASCVQSLLLGQGWG